MLDLDMKTVYNFKDQKSVVNYNCKTIKYKLQISDQQKLIVR